MKCTAVTFAALAAVATAKQTSGPVLHINVDDPSLSQGVGSLNLSGEVSRELVENVNAGLKYDYNTNRGLPSSLWVSTSAEVDDDVYVSAKAEYDLKSKSTIIEARLERGDDEIAIDFDTLTNEAGPLRIRKVFDANGRRLVVKPKFNVRDRTGELVINSEIDSDITTAELTLDQATDSASLEVSHRLDEYNIVCPKVDLKNGDMSVRLVRALENGGVLGVTADKRNIDWELEEDSWTVKGNIPLEDTQRSTISFKRSISLS